MRGWILAPLALPLWVLALRSGTPASKGVRRRPISLCINNLGPDRVATPSLVGMPLREPRVSACGDRHWRGLVFLWAGTAKAEVWYGM